MKANALLEKLMGLTNKKPDVVPQGFKSIKEWAVEFGKDANTTRLLLAKGAARGVLEAKTFKLARRGCLVSVVHYRPKS